MPAVEATAPVAHQFVEPEQQREAATLGIWVFLATEVLFFGGMFLVYSVYRHLYTHDFHAASNHTLIAFGGTNTGILLISSFCMALAVRASEMRARAASLKW